MSKVKSELIQRIDEMEARLTQRLSELEARFNARMDELDVRLNTVESRWIGILIIAFARFI